MAATNIGLVVRMYTIPSKTKVIQMGLFAKGQYRKPMRYQNSSPAKVGRVGLTLIEVMIATTLTLLLLLSLAQGFKSLSETVSAGRSRLGLSDQLRGISSLLKSDLAGLTVNSTNPQPLNAATGYFKYYDGPISDPSATLFNYLPVGTVEQRVGSNRWGDIDDVLVFTTQSEEGALFSGKMPLALLYINSLNKGIPVPLSTRAEWLVAWRTDVSIASRYAEIAWFMRPLNDNGSIDIQETMPPVYGDTPPETSVIDSAAVVDLDGDSIADPDGMPDRLALCRRVLLIRPDLDIARTSASNIAFLGIDPQVTMSPLPLSETSVNSFKYAMRFAHQRCDLSVHLNYNDFVAANSFGPTLKTNSLAELQRPENRFAHYVMPLKALGLGTAQASDPQGTTLPILALTSEAAATGNYLNLTNQIFGTLSPAFSSVNVAPSDRGFIPSTFFRTNITLDPNTGNVLTAIPTLEEIVASNVVAFDIKGYDLAVKQLASPGPDGGWGELGFNDDGLNAFDDVLEAGWPGTDDLSLTPSDPGFSRALATASLALPLVAADSGAFVDLDWSRKAINAPHRLSLSAPIARIGMAGVSALSVPNSFWTSNLSGVDINSSGAIEPSANLVKSGCVSINGTGNAFVYQPSFDTFTDAYESDGEFQENMGGRFIAARDSLRRFGRISSTVTGIPDLGTDGLGNDDLEKETSPPFAYRLPSFQATIRVQDFTAGSLQQISVVHDLTN
jgi:hypothetical protein